MTRTPPRRHPTATTRSQAGTATTASLVARYSGGSYYGAYVTGDGFAVIVESNAGVLTAISSTTQTSRTGTLRFEVVGTSLRLFVNDTLLCEATRSTFAGAGGVGFFAG